MADKFGAGIVQGSTSVSIPVELWVASTQLPRTSVAFGVAHGAYWRQGAAMVTVALVSLTNAASAWASGGWVNLANNLLGGHRYRFDVPDAAFASGVDWVTVIVDGGTNSTVFFAQTYPLVGIGYTALGLAPSAALVAYGAETTAHANSQAASLALAAYTGVSTALASWTGVSTALTAYSALTTTQGNALAASLALAAYTGVSTALAAWTGVSTALTAYGGETTAHANSQAASLALAAYTGVSAALASWTGVSTALAAYNALTTVHGDALAASTALAAYTGVSTALAAFGGATQAQVNALAASTALTAYTGVSTALSAYGGATQAQVNALAASLALTAYGALTSVDLWAHVIDTMTAEEVMKNILAYISGNIAKNGDAYAYYDYAGSVVLWTSTVSATDRVRS